MNEIDATKKALLLSGFVCGGDTFFFEDTSKQVYIHTKFIKGFDEVIEYMEAFVFNRMLTVEERKIYYQTSRKLKDLREKFWTTSYFSG